MLSTFNLALSLQQREEVQSAASTHKKTPSDVVDALREGFTRTHTSTRRDTALKRTKKRKVTVVEIALQERGYKTKREKYDGEKKKQPKNRI